jgi:hypothetical protein
LVKFESSLKIRVLIEVTSYILVFSEYTFSKKLIHNTST